MPSDTDDRAAKIRTVLDQLDELIPEEGGTLEIYRDEKRPWHAEIVGDDVAVLRLGQALLRATVVENGLRRGVPHVTFPAPARTQHVGIMIDAQPMDPRPRSIDIIKQLNGTLILITVLHVLILILVISTLLVVSTGRTG